MAQIGLAAFHNVAVFTARGTVLRVIAIALAILQLAACAELASQSSGSTTVTESLPADSPALAAPAPVGNSAKSGGGRANGGRPAGATAIPPGAAGGPPRPPAQVHGPTAAPSRPAAPTRPASDPAPVAVAHSSGSPSPAPVDAPKNPLYEARLTNEVVKRQSEELLSVAVSTMQDAQELKQLLERHQASTRPADSDHENVPSAAVSRPGTLETRQWHKFDYVLARIQCPEFLDCVQQPPQSRTNDPLIWDWLLKAKRWDDTYSGNITITFAGDNSPSGTFAESIAAMPPLYVGVRVDRDLGYWGEIAKKVGELLSQFKGILLTLAAIGTILWGWKKKMWRSFGRR